MDLSNKIDELLDCVDDVGQKYIAPYAKDVDKDARFPEEAFTALKEQKLLGVYIPKELGGEGLSVVQVSQICGRIAHYCASTALIYAMHQSQVACLVHHAFGAPMLIEALQLMAAEQLLVASSTSEVGVGGDLRSSICALVPNENDFVIEKNASVLSYAEKADVILITCKRSTDATANDQVLVLGYQKDCTLTKTSEWDTLGFRGTCSAGFKIVARGSLNHVFPSPFVKILGDTMQPIAHIYWGAVWLGMATFAVDTVQKTIVSHTKKKRNGANIQSFRYSELNAKLSSMRSNLTLLMQEYDRFQLDSNVSTEQKMQFAATVNDSKINLSKYLIEIASDAMMLIGISSYSVVSENSLCQLLRDAYGAPLMVSNDRLFSHNAILHLANT